MATRRGSRKGMTSSTSNDSAPTSSTPSQQVVVERRRGRGRATVIAAASGGSGDAQPSATTSMAGEVAAAIQPDVTKMKLQQLRDACATAGLETTGRVAELRHRLLNSAASAPTPTTTSYSSSNHVDLSRLKVAELRALCLSHGLPTDGTAAILRTRLASAVPLLPSSDIASTSLLAAASTVQIAPSSTDDVTVDNKPRAKRSKSMAAASRARTAPPVPVSSLLSASPYRDRHSPSPPPTVLPSTTSTTSLLAGSSPHHHGNSQQEEDVKPSFRRHLARKKKSPTVVESSAPISSLLSASPHREPVPTENPKPQRKRLVEGNDEKQVSSKRRRGASMDDDEKKKAAPSSPPSSRRGRRRVASVDVVVDEKETELPPSLPSRRRRGASVDVVDESKAKTEQPPPSPPSRRRRGASVDVVDESKAKTEQPPPSPPSRRRRVASVDVAEDGKAQSSPSRNRQMASTTVPSSPSRRRGRGKAEDVAKDKTTSPSQELTHLPIISPLPPPSQLLPPPVPSTESHIPTFQDVEMKIDEMPTQSLPVVTPTTIVNETPPPPLPTEQVADIHHPPSDTTFDASINKSAISFATAEPTDEVSHVSSSPTDVKAAPVPMDSIEELPGPTTAAVILPKPIPQTPSQPSHPPLPPPPPSQSSKLLLIPKVRPLSVGGGGMITPAPLSSDEAAFAELENLLLASTKNGIGEDEFHVLDSVLQSFVRGADDGTRTPGVASGFNARGRFATTMEDDLDGGSFLLHVRETPKGIAPHLANGITPIRPIRPGGTGGLSWSVNRNVVGTAPPMSLGKMGPPPPPPAPSQLGGYRIHSSYGGGTNTSMSARENAKKRSAAVAAVVMDAMNEVNQERGMMIAPKSVRFESFLRE